MKNKMLQEDILKDIEGTVQPEYSIDYTADVSVALGNTLYYHCVCTGLMCWYTDCSLSLTTTRVQILARAHEKVASDWA